MPKIELGVHTGQQNISLEELRRLWRHCDENGFDWISVWDHFYEAPNRDNVDPTYEAVALMAAMAVDTKNVRIGCLVFCMNYRNPALLAKSMTTIDHISGGRVTVGLGAGWHVQEHAAYGYNFPPLSERFERLIEGTRIIRGMLTKDHTTLEGKHYRVANIANNPAPVQARLPVIIGGGGEQRTLRIAARRADGWNVPYIGADVFKHKSQVLDEWCEKQGRDPKSIEKSVNLHFLMSSKGVQRPGHAFHAHRRRPHRRAPAGHRPHRRIHRWRRPAREHRHPPARRLGSAAGVHRGRDAGVPVEAVSCQLSAVSQRAESVRDFRKLQVWEKAHKLALDVYAATAAFPASELYGLTSQLRRSAASVGSNIAEGCGRETEAELARFCHIAMGSASEAEYQLLLAKDLGFLSTDVYQVLNLQVIEVKRMLTALILKLKADR